MKPFITALRFLTILPIAKDSEVQGKDLAKSTAYFPLVGALIGLLLAVADLALKPFFPTLIVNLLILIVLVVSTGALHLDGFIDSVDGLFSGQGKEKMLEIMRDSRVGAFGILAVIGLLSLKYAFLSEIHSEIRYATLILMPTLSRWAVVYAARMYPYARKTQGTGEPFAKMVGAKELTRATLITAALTILLLGFKGIIIWLSVFLGLILLCRWINRKIGGMTGDTLGAVIEASEAIVLIAVYLSFRAQLKF